MIDRFKKFLGELLSGKYPLGLFFSIATAYFFTPLFLLFKDNTFIPFTLISFSFIITVCLSILLFSLVLKKLLPSVSYIFDTIMHSFTMYILITVIFSPVYSGILDGRDIVISRSQMFYHIGLYVVCLLIIFIGLKKQQVCDAYRKFTAILGCFSITTGLAIALIYIPVHDGSTLQKVASLSPSHNIILICLDSVQPDFAKPYFDNSQLAQEQFDGFYFFTNTASASRFTHLSLSALIRGNIFTGHAGKVDPHDNLLNDFINYKYNVNINRGTRLLIDGRDMYNKSIYSIPDIIGRSVYDDTIKLFYVASLRFLPFTLPTSFFYQPEYGWLSKRDYRRNYQAMIDSLNIDYFTDKKVLWIHNLQAHSPVRFTKEGKYDIRLTPDDVYGEVADALAMTGKFFDKLKQLGVYDKSLIIVFADHGFQQIGQMASLSKNLFFLNHKLDKIGHFRIGQYRPLLMVKPPGGTGILKYNDSAVTLLDFRKTLNEFMSGEDKTDFYGINFLNFKNNTRQRSVPYFHFADSEFTFKREDYFSTDNWSIAEFNLPMAENYQYQTPVVSDLLTIKNALDIYYQKNNAYPLSQGWDGIYSNYGYSGADWIKNLVPNYLPYLPRDPRNEDNGEAQYLYFSDGKDYKLISHRPYPLDMIFVQHFYPELVDPHRPTWAFGFWTKGAEDK